MDAIQVELLEEYKYVDKICQEMLGAGDCAVLDHGVE